MRCTSAVLVALLQTTGALRKGSSQEGAKKVAGVPILNYRYRLLQSSDVESAQAGVDSSFDWVIKFKDGMGDEEIVKFCESEGEPACWAMGHPGHGGVPLATVRSTEGELRKMLELHSEMVEFVEPDTPVELEPDFKVEESTVQGKRALWNLENVNIAQAKFTGQGTHIYVMDTGVRVSHQDFGGRAIPTVDTIAGRGAPKECQPGDSACAQDTRGHGTHVAGTAGGATFGVAKGAVLHAMKVCCGSGTNINGGMDWIGQYAQKPAVMTMSLGSYTTPESSRVAVDAVVASGVTVTVSAGNRGTESCLKSFTFIASAIGVGSSTSTNSRSSFSNWGDCNAIFAPGSSITSASYRSDTGSATMSGTSMAAPLVAGGVALLLQENPALTAAEVRSTLRERATAGQLKGLKQGDPNLLLNVGDF